MSTNTHTYTPITVFSTDGRNVCVPSETNERATIVSVFVEFPDRPTCVWISGDPSIVTRIDLQSCFSDNWIALIRTGDLFNDTAAGEFQIIVDDQNITVEFSKLAVSVHA